MRYFVGLIICGRIRLSILSLTPERCLDEVVEILARSGGEFSEVVLRAHDRATSQVITWRWAHRGVSS